MDTKANFDNITVVLQRPKYAGNVGSVARAMKNMGLSRLVISEADPFPADAMKMMSTHFAADIIDGIMYSPRLAEALADCQYIVGTTARLGSVRGPVVSPREMAERIVGISQQNRVAILFGSEDKGLSNDELRFCHGLVTIPVSEELTSLNLAQAVMVLCYEVFLAGTAKKSSFTPKLATSSEIEGMYGQLKDVLMEVGFLNPQNPEYFMTHIRRLFSRTHLFSRDVKIIRGICRQVTWAVRNKPPVL
ncbi:MAG: tRNA (cytidine/uridine/adenosine-2'-O-)-methyltransferase TrmJ [Syntrophus sp. SKADARSKE-3]|nr:tRNA (cytidine/uridine/adenosine-2'-O-)-methyltransferase TrmJ [Syntrophus sp. SKADARSKE-3]